MFADESAHVASRARTKTVTATSNLKCSSSSKSQPSKPHSAFKKTTKHVTDLILQQPERDEPSLSLLNPSPDYDEQGTNFFFTYHIIGIDQASASAPQISDYASDIIDDTLIASIKALGLASFGNFARSSGIRRQANIRYLESVQLTNKALRDRHLVKKDSTLLAVLLLSQYESVCGDTENSIKDWANHVNGAAALVKLRGLKQLETRAGLRMFVHAMVNAMIAYTQEDKELPDWMLELREEAGQYLDPRELNWRFHDLAIKYMRLHSWYKRKIVDDQMQILSAIADLDTQFEQTFTNDEPSSLSGFSIVHDEDPDHEIVFGEEFYVYNDFLYATTWNSMRTLRIVLNEDMRNIIQKGWLSSPPRFLEEKYAIQHDTTIKNLYKLQAEIFASVPQHLGYHKAVSPASTPTSGPTPYKFLWSSFASQGCAPFRHDAVFHPIHPNISTIPAVRMAGGNFLPWHLHLAGVMDISTPEVVEWSFKILQRIGHEMSLKQSLVFGQQIIDGFRMTPRNTEYAEFRKALVYPC